MYIKINIEIYNEIYIEIYMKIKNLTSIIHKYYKLNDIYIYIYPYILIHNAHVSQEIAMIIFHAHTRFTKVGVFTFY